MPFNGSGSYSPPSQQFPINNGSLADAQQVDAIITDISSGISQCITKDGQTTLSNNIPFNGFKATGMGPGAARTDSATIANLQDNTGCFVPAASVGGTGDVITLSPSPAIAAYATGQRFQFFVKTDNTTFVTVAVSGLAARDLVPTSNGGQLLIAGDLTQDELVEIVYDGTRFVLDGGGKQTQRTSQQIDDGIFNNCIVTADPTADLGVAPKQYVDRLWTTGDVKVTLKTTADDGWVMFDDGTIGSASSGASNRANSDCEDLFKLIWNVTIQANCQVIGGRGADADSDWSANKKIELPKVLGRALAIAGSGSGLTSRALAQALGSEDAINVSHTHTVTDTHSHTVTVNASSTAGANTNWFLGDSSAGGRSQGSGGTTGGSVAVNNSGSSATGANMPPTVFLNAMVKL